MYSYRVAGLSVRSEIDLPGLIATTPDSSEADVLIAPGAVPKELDTPAASGPTWAISGDRFLLRIPDVARFLLTAGREIMFETENGTPSNDIAIFLIGTVLGILLHQRERIVLHASGIWVNGKAVLFCGASGAGKSTIAAALGQRGYPLVTDDLCAIAFADDAKPIAHPDGRQLKLWAKALERLGLNEDRGARVRDQLEKYYVEPADAFSEPLPIGAVYALREARPPHDVGIEQPNIVDAALLMRSNAYRPLLVRRMAQRANYFRAATAIANAAGVYFLTRHLNFGTMPDVIAALERHWGEIGLTGNVS